MRSGLCRFVGAAGALLTAMVIAWPGVVSAQDPLAQRPTEVSATMGNSPRLYNGTYGARQVSRMCGEIDPAQSFAPARAFIVEYPLDDSATSDIVDVRFTSKALVGSVKETGKFFVSVTVRAKIGGRPPAYVVDTERPAPKHSGTASLSVTNGVARLTVRAVDELGQTLDLTVVCHPPRASDPSTPSAVSFVRRDPEW